MPQESGRRSFYSSHTKTVNDLLKNFELVRKFRSIFHYGEKLKRGFNYKIPTEEENDEFIALLIDLELAEYDWNELKKQKHREVGNRLIEFRFNGDKILDIFDRLECRKPIIRKPTLEKISVQLANIATGLEIVEYLKGWGVSEGLIEYPNTKWRTVFGVLSYYANSPDQEDHKMLLKIIAEILHPLLYSGSWEQSQKACKEFNNHLFYDNYVARWVIGSKRYIVEYEPSGDEDATISEEQEKFYENLWAQEEEAERAFWQNPKNREAISTLRKAYQTLINIVEVFCENPSKPTDGLNEAYLKTRRIVMTISNTLCTDGKEVLDVQGTLSGGLYYPFNNLFNAEVTAKTRGETISWDSIRPRMHSAYGDIDSLFQKAQGSDVISTPDTQKTLNDISLLLSQTREKDGLSATSHSQKKSVLTPKPAKPLIVEITAGDLQAYNDGSIRYKETLLEMRGQLKELCRLFMVRQGRLVTIDDIREEIISADKRKTTSNATISKYVSELHVSLKLHFKKDVFINQKEEGWFFKS